MPTMRVLLRFGFTLPLHGIDAISNSFPQLLDISSRGFGIEPIWAEIDPIGPNLCAGFFIDRDLSKEVYVVSRCK